MKKVQCVIYKSIEFSEQYRNQAVGTRDICNLSVLSKLRNFGYFNEVIFAILGTKREWASCCLVPVSPSPMCSDIRPTKSLQPLQFRLSWQHRMLL